MATRPYTFELDDRLMQQFAELAHARNSSVAELLPQVIRDFLVADGDPDFNAWVLDQVQAGVDEVEAGEYIPGEEVEAEFAALRAATQRRLRDTSR